nr:PREDICTED: RNA-directed DNA polymerase from mobile element jockey-like [Linepithema humile]
MLETARICRILARNPDATLEAIALPDGTVVTGERCLEHLLEVSFPGFHREPGELFAYKEPGSLRRARQADWRMAAKIVMPEKVKACIAMGYTPSAWKLAGSFIPKAGRTSYTKAKDFRPISLTSFLLKTLEKLVDAYLRETTLWSHPLHKNQHAYRSGYFTETALHQTVAFIVKQLERKGYAVGAFLDIEGAFNNTPHEVVCEEAARRGVPMKLVEWIWGILGRRVMTSLGTAKVYGLLKALDDRGFTAQGYADDVAILVRGPFLKTLLELMQGALKVVEEWCQRTGLAVNPLKTGLTVLTRKYKVGTIVGPTLGGVRLVPNESVKYLGVILDKKLLWEKHLCNRCKGLCQYFWMCRRTFGQTWGLKPSMIHWIYTAILRPRLTYAAVVWWTKVQKKTAKVALEHVRALILRGALGAMVTTPVAAMFGIEPFHQVVVAAAAMAAYRLRCELKWKKGARHTRLPEDVLLDPIFEMRQDRIPIIRASDRRFKAGLRHKMLGSALLGPEQIRKLPVRDLILFWRKTGLS